MGFRIAFLVLNSALVSFVAQAETSRPMDEMHGDCRHFAVDLTKEFALWSQPGVATGAGVTNVPLAKKLSLSLVDQKSVKFMVPLAKTFPTRKPRGGLFSFEVPASGSYRVSAGSKIWFDVVDVGAGKAVEASSFEMQTRCKTIFKTVAYELSAGRRYALQVSSGDTDQVGMSITSIK